VLTGRIERIDVGDISVEVRRAGSGSPLLLLHGEDGTLFLGDLISRLAASFDVIAPSHPAWAGTKRSSRITTIDDIAYLYLDLLRVLNLASVTVAGLSMGGWIAAEMATKSEEHIGGLVLVAPLGIKVRGTTDRDIVDIYAISLKDVPATLYSNPARRIAAIDALDEQGLFNLALAQEATVRYGWVPFMHNAKLRARLRRIRVPALVTWGSADKMVYGPEYYTTYAAAIGSGAQTSVIQGAGHRVEEETPSELAKTIADFAGRAVPQLA
jgi:pimeloyl-ACP methyl ester carboxylesterase